MPATPRRSQLRIAHSSTFAVQSAFGTELANAAIDKVFSLSDDEPKFEIVTRDDQIKDCTGQYIVDEIVQARKCRLSFGIEAEASVIAGLLGWFFGVVSANDRLMLGPTVFQPPATTFIYGHNDGTQPLKLKDMVAEAITISGRVNDRIRATVSFVGHGNPVATTAYTFPDCATITPIYLKDGAFSVNSVDYLPDTREFEFSFSNNLLSEEDPFTLASVDIQRLERADERDYSLKWTVFGKPGDALHLAAVNKTKYPFSFRIGPITNGVTISAVSAILKQNGGPKHDGEARRSALDLLLLPIRIAADANTPVKGVRNV